MLSASKQLDIVTVYRGRHLSRRRRDVRRHPQDREQADEPDASRRAADRAAQELPERPVPGCDEDRRNEGQDKREAAAARGYGGWLCGLGLQLSASA